MTSLTTQKIQKYFPNRMTDWRRSQATIRLLSPLLYRPHAVRIQPGNNCHSASKSLRRRESERCFVNKSYRKKRSGKKRKILGKTEVKR